jgi:hypothetical protein
MMLAAFASIPYFPVWSIVVIVIYGFVIWALRMDGAATASSVRASTVCVSSAGSGIVRPPFGGQ